MTACGRLGFDPLAPSGDGGTDSSRDTTSGDAMVVPAGPAVWLRMETDPNTGIVDSGGGHTVACATPCPLAGPGEHGGGYELSTNEVDVAAAADIGASSAFTGAVWVKLSALPSSEGCVWSKPFDNTLVYDTFTLCIDPTGATIFDCETPGGVADSETGPTIQPGAWHHLAMTWDGTTKRGYLDGTEVVTKNVQIGGGNLGFTLGGEGLSYFTPGTVDDAIYYTRALTPGEIAQLSAP